MNAGEEAKRAKLLAVDTNSIANKMKRQEVYQEQKSIKRKMKKKAKLKRKKLVEQMGDDAPPAQKQKTQDNTKEVDETVVQDDDEEVQQAEAVDEFSSYFEGEIRPKILITTNYKPTKRMIDFIRDLLQLIPNSFYYSRRRFAIKKVIEYCKDKDFTNIIVINEDRKKLNAMTITHLPEGPTAHFKLTSVKLHSEIKGAGVPSSHKPEVILNNFTTRLGHRIGRLLGSLFHQEPNFKGRRVATFHNQRDFIFFRHHRYIFSGPEKARIQELGPEFTLKLKWLQHGTFDTKFGEYEWLHKKEMDTSRKRFFL